MSLMRLAQCRSLREINEISYPWTGSLSGSAFLAEQDLPISNHDGDTRSTLRTREAQLVAQNHGGSMQTASSKRSEISRNLLAPLTE